MTNTVLIVEDDRHIRDIYELILNRAGITTLTAADGQTGLDLALEHRPDLILLDLMLPIMSGQEMLKQLRLHMQHLATPVIILTNIGRSEVPKKMLDSSVKDILIKVDLDPDTLVKKVTDNLP